MKLRVFTAFSGYDSQCMALDKLGIDYELVGWSEIDKYAIQAHNAVFPEWAERNFGDISKIDWANVPDFDLFTYIGNKQMNPFRGDVEGVSPCITSACGAGGGMTPMLTDAELETTKTKEFIEQVRGHQPMNYRIRKLTPRECFRMMGVSESDIDKISQCGVSQSQQYKMAGNSIVVDVLEQIFRKLFVDKEQESQQLRLF